MDDRDKAAVGLVEAGVTLIILGAGGWGVYLLVAAYALYSLDPRPVLKSAVGMFKKKPTNTESR